MPATSFLDKGADIRADIAENPVPTVGPIEAMRRHGRRRLMVLSSGGTVYGTPERDPIFQGQPTNPISCCGIVKLALEKYLEMEHRPHGLR
ncbi:NAD-dependent epimerase/dehydratase family protein [Antarcticimicrobium luteum]|uniref:NAD-dependent epimerase/dehydratase family protein n=1 Tax=Antarcticimicrobium luteum TaxID=2547397 RepID=A0A4R5V635_9RHOB|nr:NAD-dependent epimerase/dehydratase family protein [Antarcticimicrobium luteum]TDK47463.1 NAD-dependent epimerase/dehydratase family protein [Antarcticimicrobium luteum]